MRQTSHSRANELAPITLRIVDACRITGIGRSKFYELIKAGEIEVIKVGAITLVPMTSIHGLIERGRPARGEDFLGQRVGAVMHPLLATAILTAALAKAPDDLRRDLSSPNEIRRAKAENALVERMIAAIYEQSSESEQTAG